MTDASSTPATTGLLSWYFPQAYGRASTVGKRTPDQTGTRASRLATASDLQLQLIA